MTGRGYLGHLGRRLEEFSSSSENLGAVLPCGDTLTGPVRIGGSVLVLGGPAIFDDGRTVQNCHVRK